MNKQELISKIAEKSNLSKKNAAAALTALIDTITKALKAEGKLAIPNLGTFQVKEHAARIIAPVAARRPRQNRRVKMYGIKVTSIPTAMSLSPDWR